jgi:outer membrane protein assembly factor BamE
MHRLLSILMLASFCALTACQGSAVKDFQKIKPGMEKDDVLAFMGNPSRTQRFHGKDRWTYIFYDQSIRFEKEIQFFEGNAIYIGDTWQPPEEQSAFVADKKNEERNASIDAELAKEATEARSAYSSYEARVKGTDKVRYVPTFTPLK